jgi:hypothetical protein
MTGIGQKLSAPSAPSTTAEPAPQASTGKLRRRLPRWPLVCIAGLAAGFVVLYWPDIAFLAHSDCGRVFAESGNQLVAPRDSLGWYDKQRHDVLMLCLAEARAPSK